MKLNIAEVSAVDDEEEEMPNPNRKSMIKFMTDDELDDMGKGNFTRQDTPHPKELKERHKRLLAKQKVSGCSMQTRKYAISLLSKEKSCNL